jgi:integrase/recombinase XerD
MIMNKHPRQGQAEILSQEQIKRVINHQKSSRHSARNICLIHLSIFLGCRVGEIAQLTIGDLFIEGWQLKEQVILRKEYCKNNKTRTLYLTYIPLRKAIEDYANVRRKDCPEPKSKDMKTPFILSQKGGWNAAALQQLYKKMYLQVGLGSQFSSHSGRRTFISNLISSGIDLKSVSTLAGHSSIQTTCDIYAKSNPIQMASICKNITIQ